MSETAVLDRAVAHLVARGIDAPAVVLVLGSGLKSFGEQLEGAVTVPFVDVPEWPAPRVEGHGASLVTGTVEGLSVACLTGRVHLYEGWSPAEVVRAVRTLRRLGAPRFVLTNAAGGISRNLVPGDLMMIRDHINLTGHNALAGPGEDALGPRFPDQTAVYGPALAAALRSVDPGLAEGVYAGNLGPTYETPAEVRMLAAMGADAVGMSTVLEASALHAMGAQVAGISLISNLAAGISKAPLSHDEVIEEGRRAETRFVALLRGFCTKLSGDTR